MPRPIQSGAPVSAGAQAGDGSPPGGTRAEALRRLQTGAVGVVAVLLLIGLASIVKDRATQTENTAVAGAAPTTAPRPSAGTADPLAEAGVVPDMPASPDPSVTAPASTATADIDPPPHAR